MNLARNCTIRLSYVISLAYKVSITNNSQRLVGVAAMTVVLNKQKSNFLTLGTRLSKPCSPRGRILVRIWNIERQEIENDKRIVSCSYVFTACILILNLHKKSQTCIKWFTVAYLPWLKWKFSHSHHCCRIELWMLLSVSCCWQTYQALHNCDENYMWVPRWITSSWIPVEHPWAHGYEKHHL